MPLDLERLNLMKLDIGTGPDTSVPIGIMDLTTGPDASAIIFGSATDGIPGIPICPDLRIRTLYLRPPGIDEYNPIIVVPVNTADTTIGTSSISFSLSQDRSPTVWTAAGLPNNFTFTNHNVQGILDDIEFNAPGTHTFTITATTPGQCVYTKEYTIHACAFYIRHAFTEQIDPNTFTFAIRNVIVDNINDHVRELSITPTETITHNPLDETIGNQNYTRTLQGATGTVTWSLLPAFRTTVVPDEITIDSSTGMITITNLPEGDYSLFIQAQDSGASAPCDKVYITLRVRSDDDDAIIIILPPSCNLNFNFNSWSTEYGLATDISIPGFVSGNQGDVSYTTFPELSGVSITPIQPDGTGIVLGLDGTTVPGTHTFNIIAQDDVCSESQEFTLTVLCELDWNNASVGVNRNTVSHTFNVPTNIVGTVNYTHGTLPQGVTSSTSGESFVLNYDGTTPAGTYTVNLTISDDYCSIDRTITIIVEDTTTTTQDELALGGSNLQTDTANELRWNFPNNSRLAIDSDFIDGGGDAFLDQFSINGLSGQIRFFTASNQTSSEALAGPQMIDTWESYASAMVVEAGSLSLTLPGPNVSDNLFSDTAEPYTYNTSATIRAEIATFITAWRALSDADKNGTTLTLQIA